MRMLIGDYRKRDLSEEMRMSTLRCPTRHVRVKTGPDVVEHRAVTSQPSLILLNLLSYPRRHAQFAQLHYAITENHASMDI